MAYLEEKDLSKIEDKLDALAPRWEELVECLEIKGENVVEKIKKEHPHSKSALVKVITMWIRQNSKCTWKDLSKTLRNNPLYEVRLADRIEHDLCGSSGK